MDAGALNSCSRRVQRKEMHEDVVLSGTPEEVMKNGMPSRVPSRVGRHHVQRSPVGVRRNWYQSLRS